MWKKYRCSDPHRPSIDMYCWLTQAEPLRENIKASRSRYEVVAFISQVWDKPAPSLDNNDIFANSSTKLLFSRGARNTMPFSVNSLRSRDDRLVAISRRSRREFGRWRILSDNK